jgi:glycosyltransferase involved in cell wall biosynthesis
VIQPDGTTRGRIALLGRVPDDQLRWLYGRASMLVAASFEDYGLTPLEAAMFGKPTVALRAGGYLDTVLEGNTGVFFDDLVPAAIADAIAEAEEYDWAPAEILVHADRFSPRRFQARIRAVVAQVETAS